jgi:WD40 repeat protein
LSCNNRLLASASDDNTARLWNLDTNLPVGPALHHEHEVTCAAFSADAKVVVTGCEDKNAYAWDVHAILKEAGLDGLLPNVNLLILRQHNANFPIADPSSKIIKGTWCAH